MDLSRYNLSDNKHQLRFSFKWCEWHLVTVRFKYMYSFIVTLMWSVYQSTLSNVPCLGPLCWTGSVSVLGVWTWLCSSVVFCSGAGLTVNSPTQRAETKQSQESWHEPGTRCFYCSAPASRKQGGTGGFKTAEACCCRHRERERASSGEGETA